MSLPVRFILSTWKQFTVTDLSATGRRRTSWAVVAASSLSTRTPRPSRPTSRRRARCHSRRRARSAVAWRKIITFLLLFPQKFSSSVITHCISTILLLISGKPWNLIFLPWPAHEICQLYPGDMGFTQIPLNLMTVSLPASWAQDAAPACKSCEMLLTSWGAPAPGNVTSFHRSLQAERF